CTNLPAWVASTRFPNKGTEGPYGIAHKLAEDISRASRPPSMQACYATNSILVGRGEECYGGGSAALPDMGAPYCATRSHCASCKRPGRSRSNGIHQPRSAPAFVWARRNPH